MYEEFFGLDRRPFSFQPDATCIHWTTGHQSTFATLQAGIERQCPITLVTGEVGCGKTTLIRHFLETAPVDLTIGLLSNFVSGRGSVLEWALMAFDQSFEGDSEPELLQRFQEFTIAEYAAGRRTALIVDEAQNISAEDLEALRLLSNVNADNDVLLLMFLVGQPELRERLADPKFRQIVQRIGSDFHLNALTEDETADYIRFLLAQAGAGEEVFDDESLKVIFGATAGIPRKVNLLADLCMVFAFAEERRAIDAGFIRKILGDFGERGIFASLTAPSAEMPSVELDEGEHSTPIEHVAWAPKVVGLNDPLAPVTDTLLPARVTTARGPAEPAAEPAIRPGRDDRGDEDAVRPAENAGPQQQPEPEPEVTASGQSAAVSDAVPGETAVPEQMLESELPERKTAGSGWHRYLLGAAALLAVTIGGAYVGLKPEQTQVPEAPDQASPQFAQVSEPATLPDVRTSGDRDGSAALAEVLRSEIPNRPAGNGAPQQLLAQVGEQRAAAPETIPAEVARPVPVSRTSAAMSGNLSSNDGPDSAVAERGLAPLVQVAPESVLPEPGTAVQAGGSTFDVKPPPFAPVIWVQAASSAAEPVIPLSFDSWSGPVSDAVAVVRDTGLHQTGPAGREPAGRSETPLAAGRVAWREASVLAADGTRVADLSTLAAFGVPTSLGGRAQIAPLRLAALEAPGNRLGRAKQSVRLIPDGDALMLLSALDPQERLDPGQVPAGEKSPIVVSGDTADLTGRAYFKKALTLSLDDPTGAAVLYTRAALRGHKRSAYYLGQIYETGDGVPVDFSLARAWYGAMGPGDAKGQRRIRALPEPSNQQTALSVPRPLWAETIPGGSSEFVWTSGKDGDAAFFFVQVTGRDSRVPEATFKAELSGAFLELPPSAAFWRVLAVDPVSAQYAASDWVEVSQPGQTSAPAGVTSSGAEVIPSAVIAHAPGSASARVAQMSDALASMEIPARTVTSREVAGTGDRIYFFYDQDRASAEAMAELISADAANSVSKAAPSHDGKLALPGEILITLGDPRS